MPNLNNRTTLWTGGTVMLCLLVVVGAWFGLIGPRRAQVADLQAQTSQEQDSNELLRTRIAQLRDQYTQLPATKSKIDEIVKELPATADLPNVLRSVDAVATSSGLQLVSLTPGAAAAVTGSGSSARATGSAAGASSGTANLLAIPLVISVTGDYFQAVAFLRSLQTATPRALLITGLDMTQRQSGTSGVQLTINGSVFVWRNGSASAGSASVSAVTTPSPSAAVASPSAVAPVSPSTTAYPTVRSTAGTPASTSSAAPSGAVTAAAVATAAPTAEASTW